MSDGMENIEEVFHLLSDFERNRVNNIPRQLEDYLCYVAKTGDTLFQWAKVKPLFRHKLYLSMSEFHEASPTDDLPPCPNVDQFQYEVLRDKILEHVDTFHSAPFTIQRLCELITEPRKHYKRTDKYLRGIEKNILVVSTIEPGWIRRVEASGVQNGVGDVQGEITDHSSSSSDGGSPSQPKRMRMDNETLSSSDILDTRSTDEEIAGAAPEEANEGSSSEKEKCEPEDYSENLESSPDSEENPDSNVSEDTISETGILTVTVPEHSLSGSSSVHLTLKLRAPTLQAVLSPEIPTSDADTDPTACFSEPEGKSSSPDEMAASESGAEIHLPSSETSEELKSVPATSALEKKDEEKVESEHSDVASSVTDMVEKTAVEEIVICEQTETVLDSEKQICSASDVKGSDVPTPTEEVKVDVVSKDSETPKPLGGEVVCVVSEETVSENIEEEDSSMVCSDTEDASEDKIDSSKDSSAHESFSLDLSDSSSSDPGTKEEEEPLFIPKSEKSGEELAEKTESETVDAEVVDPDSGK